MCSKFLLIQRVGSQGKITNSQQTTSTILFPFKSLLEPEASKELYLWHLLSIQMRFFYWSWQPIIKCSSIISILSLSSEFRNSSKQFRMLYRIHFPSPIMLTVSCEIGKRSKFTQWVLRWQGGFEPTSPQSKSNTLESIYYTTLTLLLSVHS